MNIVSVCFTSPCYCSRSMQYGNQSPIKTQLAVVLKTHMIDTIEITQVSRLRSNRLNTVNECLVNTSIYQVIMYCHVCFVVIDISHHTVLDLVSNMDGVLKHVPSINPDDMHPTPFKPNPSSNPDDIPPTPLKPVPSINPDNMPPTSCWQQIRKNLVHILCSKYVACAIIIAIIAVLCVILSTHCKYTIYC